MNITLVVKPIKVEIIVENTYYIKCIKSQKKKNTLPIM